MNKRIETEKANLWEKRFTEPGILFMQVARNAPEKAILVSNITGNYEIHSLDIASGKICQLTDRPQGTLFGSISLDGQYVYYFDDSNGAENGHFMRIPFSGGKSEDITPGLKPYFSFSVSSDDKGSSLVFSAAIDNENRVYLVSTKDNSTQIPRVMYSTKQFLQEPVISSDGLSTCCVIEANGSSPSKLLTLDNATGNIATEEDLGSGGKWTPLAFCKDKVLLHSNQSGTYAPVIFDTQTRKFETLKHKNIQGDVFILNWDNSSKLLLVEMKEGKEELYLFDYIKETVKMIGPTHGCFDPAFGMASFLSNGNIALKWQAFNTPPSIIEIIAPKYDSWVTKIHFKHTNDDSKRMAENAFCTSSDGEKIHILVSRSEERYLTDGKKLPFVIDIHGGPHGISRDEYSPRAQMWLDQGYGYCTVNYRGSIGFGKDFERKIYGNPGHWEVEDVVATRKWLIENASADPRNIIITGWSWGGYVTLLALGKYSNLWKCGVAGTAIADCVMQYEDSLASFKAFDDEIFGGNPKDNLEAYKKSSPITYADSFCAPILIIQGENDTRCMPRQMKYFESVLKSLGKDITIKWFLSGHAGEFSDTNIRIDNAKASLAFVNKHIKSPEAKPRD